MKSKFPRSPLVDAMIAQIKVLAPHLYVSLRDRSRHKTYVAVAKHKKRMAKRAA